MTWVMGGITYTGNYLYDSDNNALYVTEIKSTLVDDNVVVEDTDYNAVVEYPMKALLILLDKNTMQMTFETEYPTGTEQETLVLEKDGSSDDPDEPDEPEEKVIVWDEVTGKNIEVPISVVQEGTLYRMYDPNRGEHFYTKSKSERDNLVRVGWRHESNADFTVIAAEENDAIPVYRVYNPNGEHNWVTDPDEYEMLKTVGWQDEGICWRVK